MESLTPPRMFTAAMRARKSGSDRHATCGGGRGAISKSMSSQQHTTLRKIRYGSANCTPFIATATQSGFQIDFNPHRVTQLFNECIGHFVCKGGPAQTGVKDDAGRIDHPAVIGHLSLAEAISEFLQNCGFFEIALLSQTCDGIGTNRVE